MTIQKEYFEDNDNLRMDRFRIQISGRHKRGLYRNYAKRPLDLILVLLAAPIVLPVVVFLALLIASDGYNPFYKQKRIGRYGHIFSMWKLRSMLPDAEKKLEAHLASCPMARSEWSEKQKLVNDPRVTSLGFVIRKTSMDELPQLWNVLVGNMSLVGPRPMMLNQRELYPGKSYFALRPGLSGFWQISERNNSTFAERASFDDAYSEELSLKTDLRVLAGTVRVVLRATGC